MLLQCKFSPQLFKLKFSKASSKDNYLLHMCYFIYTFLFHPKGAGHMQSIVQAIVQVNKNVNNQSDPQVSYLIRPMCMQQMVTFNILHIVLIMYIFIFQ
jgi:hypothetical protein